MALPSYFYDLQGIVRLEGFPVAPRWFDEFAEDGLGNNKQRLVLTPQEWKRKAERDAAYTEWIQRFSGWSVKPKSDKWQAVRITGRDYPFKCANDWWPEFMDCVFRVYMQPHTAYSNTKGDWIQYYVVCPEDTYLVQCYKRFLKGIPYPKRNTFKWISPHPALRKMLLIPQECAPHCTSSATS